MATVTILENGNLKITIDENDREFLDDNADYTGDIEDLCHLLESYSSNGSYTPFDAGEGNPFVGFTGAPCIAEQMNYNDDGTLEIEGNFWYYPDYMLYSLKFILLRDNGIIFRLGTIRNRNMDINEKTVLVESYGYKVVSWDDFMKAEDKPDNWNEVFYSNKLVPSGKWVIYDPHDNSWMLINNDLSAILNETIERLCLD